MGAAHHEERRLEVHGEDWRRVEQQPSRTGEEKRERAEQQQPGEERRAAAARRGDESSSSQERRREKEQQQPGASCIYITNPSGPNWQPNYSPGSRKPSQASPKKAVPSLVVQPFGRTTNRD